MVDTDIVTTRLSKMKEAVSLLGFVNTVSKEDFVNNRDNFLKAERLLEIIVQSMIDIGTHIIAAKSFKKAQDYHEVFDILISAGVFPEEFSKSLHSLVGLRNLLAYEYLKIDHSELYEALLKNKEDIRLFCKSIADFIEKEQC